MYEYKAKVIRWLDGDTLEVRIDLGFYVHKEEKIRLARINAPELSEEVPYRMRMAKSARFQARKFCPEGNAACPANGGGGYDPDDQSGQRLLRAWRLPRQRRGRGDLQEGEPVGLSGEDRGGDIIGRLKSNPETR